MESRDGNKRKLFGTDGVRGVANVEPLTPETVVRLGKAIAQAFKNGPGRHKILIGKDTRLSGYMLEQALASGICSMGVDVLLVGPLSTPGIAFLTAGMRADAGVILSASHNSFEDNGIKIFTPQGFKLADEVESRIEDLVFSSELDKMAPTAAGVGKAFRIDDARGRYIQFLKSTFPPNMTLDGYTIALDCANGAAYKVAPLIFEELATNVHAVGVEPNGENINLNCGSLHPELVRKLVLDTGADLGIALDGDADRVVFVDEKGNDVDGDHIMAICAMDMQERGTLKNNTLVATVMSNMGLELAMQEAGINMVRTQVGDRYVVEEMLANGYNFGGEQSGHLIFLDYSTTGDGMIGALQILAVMKKTGKPLSELASVMTKYPQVLVNVKVRGKVDLETIPKVKSAIDDARSDMGEQGRVVVRYSGTEPKLRIMVEGLDQSKIKAMADSIADEVRAAIGASTHDG